MKKTVITATLIALLGTVAVSCQKEAEPVTSSVCSLSEYNVLYRIDNVVHHANIQSPEEWHAFLTDMLALARHGHNVSIQRTSTASQILPTKDVVTFETTNGDEAIEWVEMMTELGYDVSIEFDEDTGLYTLIAKKP